MGAGAGYWEDADWDLRKNGDYFVRAFLWFSGCFCGGIVDCDLSDGVGARVCARWCLVGVHFRSFSCHFNPF